jgi:xanthine dehydrogenase accessory factor
MKILRWAVGTEAHYIGMIGSKRKVITIYKELEKEGVAQEKLDRVRSPIGLDIGATTPEEIAVSVVAELIAVRRHAESALPHMRLLRKLAEQAQVADPAPVAS